MLLFPVPSRVEAKPEPNGAGLVQLLAMFADEYCLHVVSTRAIFPQKKISHPEVPLQPPQVPAALLRTAAELSCPMPEPGASSTAAAASAPTTAVATDPAAQTAPAASSRHHEPDQHAGEPGQPLCQDRSSPRAASPGNSVAHSPGASLARSPTSPEAPLQSVSSLCCGPVPHHGSDPGATQTVHIEGPDPSHGSGSPGPDRDAVSPRAASKRARTPPAADVPSDSDSDVDRLVIAEDEIDSQASKRPRPVTTMP